MFKKILSSAVIICFFLNTVGSYPQAHADSVLNLPAPGAMVSVSPSFEPALIKGLTVHKDNPFLFDFIVDPGQSKISRAELKDTSDRMIKYFFASLTIPDKDVWVNLSPYEKDRIVPVSLGQTVMGRDLLAEDYMLKQLTASLIYPQKDLGKTFWTKVYAKAKEMYGTTQVPVNTFNKVWIVPQSFGIYEHGQTAFIVNSHLKVMLEEDYLSMTKHNAISNSAIVNQGKNPQINQIGSQIIRSIILPEIEKEINDGKNFGTLRQIVYAQALAVWFKHNLKQALINRVYANKSTVKGIDQNDDATNEAIYHQYLKAYKKGVFNYIKEDIDPVTQETLPRKYFSGGYTGKDILGAEHFVGLPVGTGVGEQLIEVPTLLEIDGASAAQLATSADAAMAMRALNLNETSHNFITLHSDLEPKDVEYINNMLAEYRKPESALRQSLPEEVEHGLIEHIEVKGKLGFGDITNVNQLRENHGKILIKVVLNGLDIYDAAMSNPTVWETEDTGVVIKEGKQTRRVILKRRGETRVISMVLGEGENPQVHVNFRFLDGLIVQSYPKGVFNLSLQGIINQFGSDDDAMAAQVQDANTLDQAMLHLTAYQAVLGLHFAGIGTLATGIIKSTYEFKKGKNTTDFDEKLKYYRKFRQDVLHIAGAATIVVTGVALAGMHTKSINIDSFTLDSLGVLTGSKIGGGIFGFERFADELIAATEKAKSGSKEDLDALKAVENFKGNPWRNIFFNWTDWPVMGTLFAIAYFKPAPAFWNPAPLHNFIQTVNTHTHLGWALPVIPVLMGVLTGAILAKTLDKNKRVATTTDNAMLSWQEASVEEENNTQLQVWGLELGKHLTYQIQEIPLSSLPSDIAGIGTSPIIKAGIATPQDGEPFLFIKNSNNRYFVFAGPQEYKGWIETGYGQTGKMHYPWHYLFVELNIPVVFSTAVLGTVENVIENNGRISFRYAFDPVLKRRHLGDDAMITLKNRIKGNTGDLVERGSLTVPITLTSKLSGMVTVNLFLDKMVKGGEVTISLTASSSNKNTRTIAQLVVEGNGLADSVIQYLQRVDQTNKLESLNTLWLSGEEVKNKARDLLVKMVDEGIDQKEITDAAMVSLVLTNPQVLNLPIGQVTVYGLNNPNGVLWGTLVTYNNHPIIVSENLAGVSYIVHTPTGLSEQQYVVVSQLLGAWKINQVPLNDLTDVNIVRNSASPFISFEILEGLAGGKTAPQLKTTLVDSTLRKPAKDTGVGNVLTMNSANQTSERPEGLAAYQVASTTPNVPTIGVDKSRAVGRPPSVYNGPEQNVDLTLPKYKQVGAGSVASSPSAGTSANVETPSVDQKPEPQQTEKPKKGFLGGIFSRKKDGDKAMVYGGIDLSQADAAMHVFKDANGGITVNVDPALIARVEREGLSRVYPVIIDMRPANTRAIFGVSVLAH